MGAFDEFKKKNKKTYQQIIHEITGLNFNKGEIIINLTDDELAEAIFFLNGYTGYCFNRRYMALHTATALKKKVICFFGPTSSAEIEDYRRIKKISPEMDCLVCYKPECDFNPNCMDIISSDMICDAIISEIKN